MQRRLKYGYKAEGWRGGGLPVSAFGLELKIENIKLKNLNILKSRPLEIGVYWDKLFALLTPDLSLLPFLFDTEATGPGGEIVAVLIASERLPIKII